MDEIVRPFIADFNYTRFAKGTWYDIFASEHPFNLNSNCVRTTFLRNDSSDRVLLITNFIDSIGLLTRVYGVASFDSPEIGFKVSYYAIRK
jgi:lipocalin